MLRFPSPESIKALTQDKNSRSLLIRGQKSEIVLHVGTELWVTAERIRDDFRLGLTREGVVESWNEIEVLLMFIRHVVQYAPYHTPEFPVRLFLKQLFLLLHVKFLECCEPHSCMLEKLDTMQLQESLRIYYDLVWILKEGGELKGITPPSPPALIREVCEERAKLLAVFGGQGNTDHLLEELIQLEYTYNPICRPFIKAISAALINVADDEEAKEYMSKGFDVLGWIDEASTRPPKEYLFSAAVSLPLVGLIQITNYYLMCKIMDISPEEFSSKFVGTTGHSQGIVAAAVISMSRTEDELIANTQHALQILFWIGLRAMQAFPQATLDPKIENDCLQNGEGAPTPMLAVTNLSFQELSQQVETSNKFLSESEKIEISLRNGPRAFVCSGPPRSLYGLSLLLRKNKAASGMDQAKIPFSERKLKFQTKFLPISSPFHCLLLKPAVDSIMNDLQRKKLHFVGSNFQIPVIATDNGRPMAWDAGLLRSLVEQICVKTVEWPLAISQLQVTHIFDFGPGHSSGIGALTHKNVDGAGVQIVLTGSNTTGLGHLQTRRNFFSSHPTSIRYGMNWAKKFQPKLVRSTVEDKIYIDTAFSRLLGRQPVMVAGMTPSTVDGDFVAACLNAGYHVELAGGGHHRECALREKINGIVEKVAPGTGLTVNVLFINQKQWGFQFPLVQMMRREGVPIEGFTCAAGVPSLEAANEILSALANVGIRHISFKPGSVDAILQVVTIARHNPRFPIILQWTGGRAGGHHSYEDFHQPILETYSAIRSCENICLVAGSGFGDGLGTWPYLDGSWSQEFDHPPMPFDGLLFGSRMMISKESKTSKSVKETIAAAAGVAHERDWVKSYKASVGGVITVISELGEPIHKIATRGVLLWKEFDETIFKLPKDKRIAYLRAHKADIIAKLNKDSHKVWFGKRKDGMPAEITEMTYEEVLERLGELLYVEKEGRWIDKSFRRLFFDFLQRAEERLSRDAGPSCIPSLSDMQQNPSIDPKEFLQVLKSDDSFDLDQLMTSEDCLHFIALCRRPGQKPVPFVPILDGDFETWFKKDSLWQSEDIEAVVDADPQRVCILQGPVAVKHCKKVDEPIKDILDDIVKVHVEKMLEKFYEGQLTKVPGEPWFGGAALDSCPSDLPSVAMEVRKDIYTITLPIESSSLPEESQWFAVLAGKNKSWLQALLFSDCIVQGRRLVLNTIKALLKPRSGHSYSILKDDKEQPISVTVKNELHQPVLALLFVNGEINLTLSNYFQSRTSSLQLKFALSPQTPHMPILEVMESRNKRIKQFYWQLWFPGDSLESFEKAYESDPLTLKFQSESVVRAEKVKKFCRIIGNTAELYTRDSPGKKTPVPMDYVIVLAWQSVIKCIFPEAVDGDLLKLVHLSNRISYMSDQSICVGDQVDSEGQIISIQWTPTGKIVEVEAIASVCGQPTIKVISRFMYRGEFSKKGLFFERAKSLSKKVIISSAEELAVFKSKAWIDWKTDRLMDSVNVGSCLLFELDYLHLQDLSLQAMRSIECNGKVYLKTDTKVFSLVGTLAFKSERLKANPVLSYLDRLSHPADTSNMFEGSGHEITSQNGVELTTRHSNLSYSESSGDLNPIHTDARIADLVSLPGTITHGMWTSAAIRALVETYAAGNQPLRVRDYDASFDDMVLPNDTLTTRLYHVGMKSGRKLVKIETVNQVGTKVFHGVAEIDEPRTAFVFTGQGSQEVGMGMDLYATSKVAKEIWDEADNHFCNKYGFSILDIVQNNPKSLTIHFGGPRGERIKNTYREMTYETIGNDGRPSSIRLFPQITDESSSYTFRSPNGLLFATQFTQPALTLLEKVVFEDMKSRGLVGPGSSFAGHSLGEYAALASVGDVLSVDTLCDIVFYRGLAMQVAVERDAEGRSSYGMVAVNPGRVGATFTDTALRSLVPLVASETGRLLEIVNYNVENWQYVVAGDLFAIDVLSNVLNVIASKKLDIKKLMEELGRDKIKEHLKAMIQEVCQRVQEKVKSMGRVTLERGLATIPLAGIDVPFHSSFLLGGVPSFRKCLDTKIKASSIDVNILRHKYIPNLTGIPFDITLDYIHRILERCNSDTLHKLVSNWDEKKLQDAAAVQEMGRSLIIELLAFQFASPVLWIDTQDVLFKEFGVERLIEVGPTPVLLGMAERTLKMKYQEYDDALNQSRTLWSYAKNKAEIYYDFQRDTTAAPSTTLGAVDAVKGAENKNFSPASEASVAPLTSPKRAPVVLGAPSKRYDDLPFEVEELLVTLIALKAKKTKEEAAPSKSIKELSGGKSTLQNEILADLQKEFGDVVPERSEELAIRDLAAHIKPTYTRQPGKYSSTLISKLVSSKAPAGFTTASFKEILDKEFGLYGKATDQLLLFSLYYEPNSRLASEEVAKEWIRDVARKFFESHNLDLPRVDAAGAQSVGVQISSAEFEKMQVKHKKFIRQQIELFASYVEHNLMEFQRIANDKSSQISILQQDLDLWLAELGAPFNDGIKPLFSAQKTRRYDSHWNWARQDVFMLYYELLFGRLVNVDRDVTAKCLHVMNRSNRDLLEFMEYHIFKSPEMLKGDGSVEAYNLTRKYGEMLIKQVRDSLNVSPRYKDVSIHTRPQITISFDGTVEYSEVRRSGVSSFEAYVREMRRAGEVPPWLYIRDRSPTDTTRWELCQERTKTYLDLLSDMAINGVTFEGKAALVTGCGKGSIGCEIVKGLLSGGAKVVVTTSSFNRSTVDFFRSIYECHGARSSCLIVAPFNQGSTQDVEALVSYIYEGLGWDLDFVIPFAAISENGRELTDLDSRSELAHRIMLTNVLRLAGNVANAKRKRRIESRPAQVLLPLSPNHGIFGGDGLYGESKIGLETLFNRWHAESWNNYLSIAGAVIGWTRGTGLMNDNNLLAEAMERSGIRTFSPNEMAFNIIGLMHPRMVRLSEMSPLYGDLNGGLDRIPNLSEMTRQLRASITDGAQIRRALARERALEAALEINPVERVPTVCRRAHLTFAYPRVKEASKLTTSGGKNPLTDLLDLSRVIVVTGFGEVGPWGNSRTRWEMEAEGELSLEGCIEMAWLMGLIKHHNGTDSNGKPYSGWVDAKTGAPVEDFDVKSRYEKEILSHSGIRLVEPELFGGYDPNRKSLCQEIAIDYDLPPLTLSSREEAEQFKLRHGAHVEISEAKDGGWHVSLRRGATIYVPKALRFDRLVAGQIPTGWNAERYGVPHDIVSQVDPVTLYVLVATVEALVAAGITDPYEFYRYVHVSELGNTSGGGEGGMLSNKRIFQNRFLDQPVAADVLQESFINTMPAWVNLLLLSSAGPIRTPVGACATAVESVELGVDSILSGKARVVIVGGYDDFQEESSYEFAQMKATSNSVEEVAKGRQPNEMSRPTATSRAGFMESQGAGIQVLMTAELALQMGCPIYGIIAATNMATDKAGRSIPAPGQGILTTARSVRSSVPPRCLSLAYRHQELRRELERIREWFTSELEQSIDDADQMRREAHLKDLEIEVRRRERAAKRLWGHDFWQGDARIAPLEGALSQFGLTIDDISVASFHGTGTKANDTNESDVVNKQLAHLGRTRGNLLPCVFQKYLTGHPKGAAAAWMLNGALQILNTGVIPGNRNADNIDERLEEYSHLLFLSRTIHTTGVRAALIKSFGFGQVGGEVLLVHPDYLFSALEPAVYETYVSRRATRQARTFRYLHDMLTGAPLVRVKDTPPYSNDLESRVYLNPAARAVYDPVSESYAFKETSLSEGERTALTSLLTSLIPSPAINARARGVGVDVQLIGEMGEEEHFLARNFTTEERAACARSGDPRASFAGRWAAKEAIFKALCSANILTGERGAGAPLSDIEILPNPVTGAPRATIRGHEDVPVRVSISHSGSYALAVAIIE